MELNKIYQEPCLDTLKRMPSNYLDCVITSPPYCQSYLFWEYMRILHEVKPKYFLLENVEMGEKWESVLSRAIGILQPNL